MHRPMPGQCSAALPVHRSSSIRRCACWRPLPLPARPFSPPATDNNALRVFANSFSRLKSLPSWTPRTCRPPLPARPMRPRFQGQPPRRAGVGRRAGTVTRYLHRELRWQCLGAACRRLLCVRAHTRACARARGMLGESEGGVGHASCLQAPSGWRGGGGRGDYSSTDVAAPAAPHVGWASRQRRLRGLAPVSGAMGKTVARAQDWVFSSLASRACAVTSTLCAILRGWPVSVAAAERS